MKLHDRFYDKEERVRMEVVKAVCEVAAENFEIIPKIVRLSIVLRSPSAIFVSCFHQLCDDLEGRMRDKVVRLHLVSHANLELISLSSLRLSF